MGPTLIYAAVAESGCLYLLGRLLEKEEGGSQRSVSAPPRRGVLARLMGEIQEDRRRREVQDGSEREWSEERVVDGAGSERETERNEREVERAEAGAAEDSGPEFWRYWTRGERSGTWERLDSGEDGEQASDVQSCLL